MSNLQSLALNSYLDARILYKAYGPIAAEHFAFKALKRLSDEALRGHEGLEEEVELFEEES